jgi:hypothetical protein
MAGRVPDHSDSQEPDNGQQPELTLEQLQDFENAQRARYSVQDSPFPTPMAEEAFYGIAGKVIRIIEPECEAPREAILAQLLVEFGNEIGRGPHCKQAGIHHLNEYTVLVGETSIGRKGTALVAIQNLRPDSETREADGLQSGEAVVHAVRDPVWGLIPVNKRKAGNADEAEKTLLDEGVEDKRLEIMEEEFDRLLAVAARPGNTLSPIIRKAWDGKRILRVAGKISPNKATDAHISMIGHVTLDALLANIAEVENKNGFSNRILWVAVRRVKEIPIPEWIDWKKHPDINRHFAEVIENFGPNASARQLYWSEDGRVEWETFYRSKSKLISETSKGIVGSLIARSHAHVLRLTMLYTVLDNSALMQPKHLQAAIAFWQYCERSAVWIFGQKTGNKMADKIYWALQRAPKGMTRTEINADVFNRHASKNSLDMAFTTLLNARLARFISEPVEDKPTERWFATNTPNGE